jgi:hypothetical protein
MAVPDQITGFLNAHRRQPYCDDCIANLVGLKKRQQSQQATKPLGGTSQFVRSSGSCSNCGRHKMVIYAK